MAGDTVITVVGNLTGDPELRFTANGATPVASFTVASTPRTFDRQSGEWKNGEALFMRCSVWREAAENVAETLTKGMRVIVQGRLTQRSYDAADGSRRTVLELQVDEVGPSLRYASAQVSRNPRGGGQGGQGGYGSPSGGQGGQGGRGGQGGYSGGGDSSWGGGSSGRGQGGSSGQGGDYASGPAQDPWAMTDDPGPAGDDPPF
ncbi:MAG: single-stranded DNA-binding protein [Bifidobacteriaceae bacterium]|jgi:single-strand DNA-binding protein|nr:single-stranded DNA-binding protein [Bifidobacteriaceae bacterium]